MSDPEFDHQVHDSDGNLSETKPQPVSVDSPDRAREAAGAGLTTDQAGTDEETMASESDRAEGKPDTLTSILEYVKLFLFVLVIALLITNFVLQRNTVKGSSMYPTLHDGDELLVEKVSRYFGAINRFDIITVDTAGIDAHANRVIKRVVGMPGETVEIKEGKVFINGEALHEAYLPEDVKTTVQVLNFQKVTLGDNEYYCLGDNRNNSNDSRYFGPVPQGNILGKLLVRIYPFDRFGNPH